MAHTLKFGSATSNEGFTPLNTASFSDLRPARIVRELIQNSLDAAAVEADERTAVIRFEVSSLGRQQIPDIRGYQSAFEAAVKYQKKFANGVLPDAAQQVVDHIRQGLSDVVRGNATVLTVVDNGIGLDRRRMYSLLGDGSSTKSEESSGSYGVGHLAPMALSDLRYMVYGGVTESGGRIAAGRTVLASHRGRKKLNAAEGYLINEFRNGLDGNLYNFIDPPYPRIVKTYIDRIESEWGHGSVVMMLAFNKFRSNTSLWEVISKVASYNFGAAIYRGKLVIEVIDSTDTRVLDSNAIEPILEQEKQRIRSARSDSFFEGLRPSGRNAYSILRTLTDSPRRHVEVDGGIAYLSLTTESVNDGYRVDLFRNGMWITDAAFALKRVDFGDRQPFHAVIEIEAKKSGDLHRLVRKAEGPMHDSLSFSLLSEIEKTHLKTALRQLSDRIKEQVPEVKNDSYMVDDFLLVNTGSGGGTGQRSFSFWGVPTVT